MNNVSQPIGWDANHFSLQKPKKKSPLEPCIVLARGRISIDEEL
ncbi:hypothetical protein [Methanosaeta sp. UBA356]|jgi:hypothetical protein|nr:hypothetical protein [Methanosaeta sp. UBA356]OPX81198.1 MAG: hypothetical protein A4E43_00729 [Methanosaeta sp. PtaB.Bin005]